MECRDYTAVVVENKMTWSQKGTCGITLLLELEGCDGDTIYHTIWITEAAAPMARRALAALGFDVDKEDIQILADDPYKLVGRKCSVTIGEEEYKGETKLKVKWLNAVNEAPKDGEAKLKHCMEFLRRAKAEEEQNEV